MRPIKKALYVYATGDCGDGCCSWSESSIRFFINNTEQYGLEIDQFTRVFYTPEQFSEWLIDYSLYEEEPYIPHEDSQYY